MLLFEWVLYVGSGIAFLGFAIGALIFFAWALISRRGEPRKRRLRMTLWSAALSAGSFLATVSMLHLVLLPGVMAKMQPGFQVPYAWWGKILSTAVPIMLYTSALLLIRATKQAQGGGRRFLLMSLGCLLLALPTYAAAYVVTYHIQEPAFARFVLIENRDWDTHVGDPAPDISVTMLDGSTKRLSAFRGKVVLLNFFSTWCGPCNYELPHLEELWNDFRNSDRFAMLVVNREETEETVTPFLSKHEFTFPVALDPSAVAFKQFAKEGIPRTYLIGRDGTILFQTLGFADDQPVYQRELATLRETIGEELATKP